MPQSLDKIRIALTGEISSRWNMKDVCHWPRIIHLHVP